jgi:hypothetical protein
MVQKGKSLAAAARDDTVSRSDASEPGLDRTIQARIGDNLRAMYDDLLQQPVPDRFKDLLGQLERTDDKGQNR